MRPRIESPEARAQWDRTGIIDAGGKITSVFSTGVDRIWDPTEENDQCSAVLIDEDD
jgi:hypothetical protein